MKQWERRGEMSKICAVIGVVRCYFCSSLKKETGTFFERCDATLLFRRFSGRCDAQSNVNSEPCFQQHPLSLVLLHDRLEFIVRGRNWLRGEEVHFGFQTIEKLFASVYQLVQVEP